MRVCVCARVCVGGNAVLLVRSPNTLYGIQEQQGRVLQMVDSLSVSTQAALSSLEARLLALQARVDSCLPGLLHSTSSPYFFTLLLHPSLLLTLQVQQAHAACRHAGEI